MKNTSIRKELLEGHGEDKTWIHFSQILLRAASATRRTEVTVVTNILVSRNTVTNSCFICATVSCSKSELTAMHCDWVEAFHQ
jgi:hypothetical protein